MKRRVLVGMMACVLGISLMAGCGGNAAKTGGTDKTADTDETGETGRTADTDEAGKDADIVGEETEIQVFIAASLNTVMAQLAEEFKKEHPQISVVFNADSSGTLMTQIQEGYECDIFFSAAQKQMDILEEEGLLVDGTRANVVNNQVVVVTRKDSGTRVTGLESLG